MKMAISVEVISLDLKTIDVAVLEYVGPEKRTMVANVPLAVFLTLGAVTLPWIATTIGNWRWYSIVTSAPLALIILAWWIVPESARWMVLRGKVDETIKTLKHCAAVNGKTVPDAVYEEFRVWAFPQLFLINNQLFIIII